MHEERYEVLATYFIKYVFNLYFYTISVIDPLVKTLLDATKKFENAAASICLLREENNQRSLYFPLDPEDMNALEKEGANKQLMEKFVSIKTIFLFFFFN